MMTVQEILNAAQQLSPGDRLRLTSQLMQLVARELQPNSQSNSTDGAPTTSSDDPLIGLFSGSPDLATQSKEILRREIPSMSPQARAQLLAELQEFREAQSFQGEPLSETVIKMRREERY